MSRAGIPDRRGVPPGWEAFPWSYFVLLRELRLERAPMMVVRDGAGPDLAYAAPGFRAAVRGVLARGLAASDQRDGLDQSVRDFTADG